MRMWMLDPTKLCRQHLLGEHKEVHMLLGSLQKKRNIAGFINTGLVEVHNVKQRHDQLVQEMLRRGYNHKSPMVFDESILFQAGKVDLKHNLADLVNRCTSCRENFIEVVKK